MSTKNSYGQFCPVAMAAEILSTRWTLLLIRELLAGSTRFNELRRGVPRMSPGLLSKRLRELEDAGLVRRAPTGEPKTYEYRLTPAGEDLRDIVMAIGFWGQRWVDTEHSLKHLDPSLLMWDMRRHLDPNPMPTQRSVIQFLYPELPEGKRNWWLIVDRHEEVDLCAVDPGFEVNLYVETDLRTMTAIWMGHTTVQDALQKNELYLSGDHDLARRMHAWLGRSPFARERPAALAT